MKMFHVRLLPVTLIAMMMVLGFRVSHLFDGREGTFIALSEAQAAADPKPEMTEEASEEKEPADEQTTVNDDDAKPAETIQGSLAGRDPTTFSPSEIALLENLARRRDEIESRNRGLDVRESLLAATEGRLDEKITALKQLEARIDSLIETHDEAQKQRIAKLVVVYEKMKPKDAARIFNDIELEVLLDVTKRMKETKVAEVLAKMSPQRAQELTIALATRQDLANEVGE